MSLRVSPDVIATLHGAGVRELLCDETGVRVLFGDGDTERPAPPSTLPPPDTLREEEPHTRRYVDPHPDLVPEDEPVSDKIARENGWLEAVERDGIL